MKLKAADYRGRLRNSTIEREIAVRLHEEDEAFRFHFIRDLIPIHISAALELANACLRDKRYFEELLDQGLTGSDVSSIRAWLECVIPRLGYRRVLTILRKRLESDPESVITALYSLWVLLPKDYVSLEEAFYALTSAAREKGRAMGIDVPPYDREAATN
jgi:hypothetical protein